MTDDELYDIAHQPGHLTTEEVFGYLNRTLDDEERKAVEEHAARCDYCLAELAELGEWMRED